MGERPDIRLRVGSADRSGLVRSVLHQAALVGRTVRAVSPGHRITPVLCFVDAEWALLARPMEIEGVVVTWPRALRALVCGSATGPAAVSLGVARALRAELQPAG